MGLAVVGRVPAKGGKASTDALSFGSHLFFLRKKSFSDMLTRWSAALEVSRWRSLSTSVSLALQSPKRALGHSTGDLLGDILGDILGDLLGDILGDL